jgi:hypothetical protein
LHLEHEGDLALAPETFFQMRIDPSPTFFRELAVDV